MLTLLLLLFAQFTVPTHTGALAVAPSGPVQPCGGAECTDNFPGTSLNMTNWMVVYPGVFAVASNQVYGNSSAQSDAAYTGATFTNNQYSCLTLATGGPDGSYLGPAVRVSSTAVTAYFAEWAQSSATINIQSVVAGSYGLSSSSVPVTIGHEYCLRAVGSTLTLTDNGTTVLTATDSSIASGYAGIAAYGNGTSYTGSNWRAGNL